MEALARQYQEGLERDIREEAERRKLLEPVLKKAEEERKAYEDSLPKEVVYIAPGDDEEAMYMRCIVCKKMHHDWPDVGAFYVCSACSKDP